MTTGIMNKKVFISLFLGTLVSVITLYFAFRNVPLAQLGAYLLSIDYFWTLVSAALVITSFFLRSFRWQYILGSSHPVGFWHAFHPLMIGFMINCILPGRVGELARPLILKKKVDIPISTGLATVVIERVFDLVMLLALFTIVSFGLTINPDVGIDFGEYRIDGSLLQSLFSGMLKLSVLLLAGIILISLEKPRSLIKKIVTGFSKILFFLNEAGKKKFDQKISAPASQMIDNVGLAMALIKQPIRLTVCLLHSIAIWLIVVLSMYAFTIGCPNIELTPAQVTATLVIICFAIALPSVPGYWGLWEAAGMFALLLFGFTGKDAAGYTLANHAVQMFPVVLVGFVSAWYSGINILQVSYQRKNG
jgi:uncharacterized protein (TIRG00374 family)